MNHSFSFPLAPEFEFWFGRMRLDTFSIFCNPFIYLWGWHFLLRENIRKQHAGTTFSETFNYWKTFCLSLDFTERGGAIYFQTTLLGFNLNFEGNYFGYYFEYIFAQILINSAVIRLVMSILVMMTVVNVVLTICIMTLIEKYIFSLSITLSWRLG